jgi:hypothetical protein
MLSEARVLKSKLPVLRLVISNPLKTREKLSYHSRYAQTSPFTLKKKTPGVMNNPNVVAPRARKTLFRLTHATL